MFCLFFSSYYIIESGLSGASKLGDDHDLAEDVFRKSLDCHAGARGLRGEIASVDLVERGKIAHIREETGGLDCFFEACACRLKYCAEVFADLLGLRGDISGFDRSACGVNCNLPRRENDISDLYCLRIRSYCLGGVFCVDFFHYYFLSALPPAAKTFFGKKSFGFQKTSGSFALNFWFDLPFNIHDIF